MTSRRSPAVPKLEEVLKSVEVQMRAKATVFGLGLVELKLHSPRVCLAYIFEQGMIDQEPLLQIKLSGVSGDRRATCACTVRCKSRVSPSSRMLMRKRTRTRT